MQALSRLIVWLLEIVAETLLIGALLGMLLFPDITSALRSIVASVLAVGLLLFLHGYYLTVGILGVVWRNRRAWSYPGIAAALFVAHMHVAISRSKSDLTLVARTAEIPFLLGGASIVFLCTCVGNWCLRKWSTRGSKSGEGRSTESASVTGA